jgi:hypothetical protein
MDGMLRRKVDRQLLGFPRVQRGLKQPRSVGMRRGRKDSSRPAECRGTFGGIYRLDRLPRLLEQHHVVFIAVGCHRSLVKDPFLRRVGRRPQLLDVLLHEVLEIPRWDRRSDPDRSTCTSIPEYCASNVLASFSSTGRSIVEYTTLASLRATSTIAAVIDTGPALAARDTFAVAQIPSGTEALIKARRKTVAWHGKIPQRQT